MSNKEIKEKIKRIMARNEQVNKSQVAKKLGISRSTLYRHWRSEAPPSIKQSALDKYKNIITELLRSKTQVFTYKIHLYAYLKSEYGIRSSESAFYRYLDSVPEFRNYFSKKKAPKSEPKPTVRFETEPGRQIQVDWKEDIEFCLKDTNETIKINVFVVLLGYSRYRFYFPSLIRNQKVILSFLTESFVRLGGVPKEIVVDNNDSFMCTPRTKGHKGEVDSRFQEFANDFGLVITPCIAGTPCTKGKVENQMKHLEKIRSYSGTLTMLQK